MNRIILALAALLSCAGSSPASVVPDPLTTKEPSQLAQLQLAQRDFDRDFRRDRDWDRDWDHRGRDRDWDRDRRWRDRDWDRDRRRYIYVPGRRYDDAPRGWRRYSSRPRDWERLNCILVGPFWFCP